jgi:MFS superfamily sulfate permease-like transporter
MIKVLCKKYNYDIKPNQELFAYSAGNIASSFFYGIPSSGGLSRIAIADDAGCRTQVNGFVQLILMIIILYLIKPAIYYLPNVIDY